MIIRIEYDDGTQIAVTPEEFMEAFTTALLSIRAGVPAVRETSSWCRRCDAGRIPDGYCSCRLGQDLKLAESRFRPQA